MEEKQVARVYPYENVLRLPLENQTCHGCLPRHKYFECWGRDYKINNGTTGTIHKAAAVTTEKKGCLGKY